MRNSRCVSSILLLSALLVLSAGVYSLQPNDSQLQIFARLSVQGDFSCSVVLQPVLPSQGPLVFARQNRDASMVSRTLLRHYTRFLSPVFLLLFIVAICQFFFISVTAPCAYGDKYFTLLSDFQTVK